MENLNRLWIFVVVAALMFSIASASVGTSISPANGKFELDEDEPFELTIFNTGDTGSLFKIDVTGDLSLDSESITSTFIPAGQYSTIKLYFNTPSTKTNNIHVEVYSVPTSGGVGISAKVTADFEIIANGISDVHSLTTPVSLDAVRVVDESVVNATVSESDPVLISGPTGVIVTEGVDWQELTKNIAPYVAGASALALIAYFVVTRKKPPVKPEIKEEVIDDKKMYTKPFGLKP